MTGKLIGIARKQKPRADLYVQGVSGVKHVGATIKIGAALLEVCGETHPCSRMDAQSQGLRAALTLDWRGGVSCKVLTPGAIAIGDRVEVVERSAQLNA